MVCFRSGLTCSSYLGGHLKPDPYNRPASLALTHGVEVAAECAAFEAETLKAVKTVVEEEEIDCDFVLTRAVDALMTDAIHDRMRAGFDLLRKAGVDVMKDVFYEGNPAKAQQLSNVKGAKACMSYSAGHVWPYKLVLALLQKAVDAGVNLQTHTPVTGVSDTADAQGYYTISTQERGSLKARKIVYATNGYTSSILPEFESKIVPVRGICTHIVVPEDKKPAPMLPHSYMIRWSATEYEYLIPRLDGSIVVGGARTKYYQDLDSWYNCVEDDKLITNGNAHHYFDGYMQQHFQGWEQSGAYTNKVWTGSEFFPFFSLFGCRSREIKIKNDKEKATNNVLSPPVMGYSTDNSPFVGALPGRANQFVVAGFTGHGMPQVFLSAKGVAAMVVEGTDFKSTGIPRIFQVTKERLASDKNSILETWAAHGPAPAVKL